VQPLDAPRVELFAVAHALHCGAAAPVGPELRLQGTSAVTAELASDGGDDGDEQPAGDPEARAGDHAGTEEHQRRHEHGGERDDPRRGL
jgi:hypothetical protein